MNISCDVILDLIPLVKDGVASKDSINLVSDHLKSCESCKLEFESHALPMPTEFDDKRVISTIKKKLFLATSALLLIGAFIGMALDKNSHSNFMPAIIIVLGIVFAGIVVFKFDLKGDRSVKRFFIGRAIGTIIVFVILGIYLLLKYGLHLF
ncbi:zf-HC2 domain-containing protein [Clostridiaceae bacterium UIB06]|uniref:Zf-HC2 domain-containing protein n=1 Tax=Clostridium thailandense TaxID=2794346 RepID=A0A949WRC2_9CLOT|nr:zf-HC2 domain-containing protein [Clostridium thailandense]MBV7273845.1 zf-HC2 domain-containing protein [Clostridium thailandense]MCH5136890.1 zf-HC2 domain-containing protein [Clostridiaceae bacterium UIB06]